MPLARFKSQIIYILLFCKLFVLGILFLHFAQHKFTYHQTKELLFILFPLFAAYLVLALKYVPNHKPQISGKGVREAIVLMGRLMPILFTLFAVVVLTFQSIGTASGQESFQRMREIIGWNEILFGVYFGYIIQVIIQKSDSVPDQNQAILFTLQQLQANFEHRPPMNSTDKEQHQQQVILMELKQTIAEGKIAKAIENLKSFIQSSSNAQGALNQVIQLSAQYNQYKERRRLNLTNNDLMPNLVANGLLEIIDELHNRTLP